MEMQRMVRRKRKRARLLPGLIATACLLGAAGWGVYMLVGGWLGRYAPGQPHTAGPGGAAAGSAGAGVDLGADGDLLAQLEAQLPACPALAPVLQDPARYPESLLKLFIANPETLDTLLAYPEQGAAAPGAVTEQELAGGFPRLMQWDTRWAYQPYGDGMMAETGCGPTCLAAVAVQLTGDPALGPAQVAAYAQAQGYYMPGTGTAWDLMAQGAAGLGLASEEMPLHDELVLGALRDGRPIICSMGQGDFTTAGHFIVLTAADAEGNITVHDPAHSANNARTWRFDELAPQIRNMWAFSVG